LGAGENDRLKNIQKLRPPSGGLFYALMLFPPQLISFVPRLVSNPKGALIMKNRLLGIVIGVVVLLWGFPGSSRADTYENKAGKVAADVLVWRPAGLILTIGGGALFVIALPISAIAGGTKKTAHTLVVTPYKFTFERPVGTDLRDYVDENGEPLTDYYHPWYPYP
jgi:hypothetical protein